MNASTDSDETLTCGDVFLVAFETFFIFFPPKLSDLVVKSRGQRLIPGELERILLTHGMPVMMAVTIVVTEDTPIVCPTDRWIDVREAVPCDFSILGLPDFFFEHCSTPRALQIDRIVNDLSNRWSAGSLRRQNSE